MSSFGPVLQSASSSRIIVACCFTTVLLTGCPTGTASRDDEVMEDPAASPGPGEEPAPPLEELPEFDASFLRGINLGNRLDAPTEGAWGARLRLSDFDFVAEQAFDHVRLPVRFNAHASENAPFTVEPAFLERVDWAVRHLLSRRLSVVLDFHHYDEIHLDPAAHRERFLGIWAQVAEHYAEYPDTLAFELLNEPSQAMTSEQWNPLLAEAIDVVRETNPTRDIIVDAVEYAATRALGRLELPTGDPHLIASVHVYEPSLFVFQGQSWIGPEYGTAGIVYPGPPATPIVPVAAALEVDWVRNWFDGYNTLPAETNPCGPATIEAQFRAIDEFIERTGLRVYNGEWGAQDGGDIRSRQNWMRAVREASEARGVGWAVWEDSGAMRLFDPISGEWNEELLASLFD